MTLPLHSIVVKREVDVVLNELRAGLWIIPAVVFHAGYDAICIQSSTKDFSATPSTVIEVVFLQITSGKTHSLNEGHFHKFVEHLSAFARISKVSIFFVLPDFDPQFRITGRIPSNRLRQLGYSGPVIYALATQ